MQPNVNIAYSKIICLTPLKLSFAAFRFWLSFPASLFIISSSESRFNSSGFRRHLHLVAAVITACIYAKQIKLSEINRWYLILIIVVVVFNSNNGRGGLHIMWGCFTSEEVGCPKSPLSRCHVTRSPRPECQQASVACRLVSPQLSTNWTATRRLCFSGSRHHPV